METYATALTYAIPGFLVLIIIESIVARTMGLKVNQGLDTVSSLSSGITNTLKSLMGLSIIILSYEWMVDRIALFEIQNSLLLYLLTFIGMDFAGYWSHRWNHEFNVLWNRHIVHHSSEEFNLSCALRQQISAIIGIYFFLYLPIALLGVPAEVVALVAPIHLFAQFWYHTQVINKMGFLEKIIVTPSHHRVHHAINPIYIDKNYSEIFIIWDKLFGTFQPELADEPPVYGVKKAVKTWNPIVINFMHLWQLIKDAWRTNSIKDKCRIWFMPTGWRPEDVANKYPIDISTNVHERPKYDTSGTKAFLIWSWMQLIITFLFMYHLLISFADFEYIQIIWYASFLMISIFAFTSLMDRHNMAVIFELAKLLFAGFIFYSLGSWYELDSVFQGANLLIVGYLMVSLACSVYFLFFENKVWASSPSQV